MHILSPLVSLIEHFLQMHIVSHKFLLNRVAIHGHFDRKLPRSWHDWLILELYPAMRCFDFEEALSKSGKEGSFRKCGRQNWETEVFSKYEIPIYEIPIEDIKTCMIHLWNTCYQEEKSMESECYRVYQRNQYRGLKAETAFSDTVAELKL